MKKTVFVTVGSTSFDDLIAAVCNQDVLEILASKGYSSIVVQVGRGTYVPTESSIIDINWYTFKDSISEDIKSSSLVISHAGAGSILEALENQKPLIVVVNDKLMNNHQEELAKELASNKYLAYCYCTELKNTVEKLNVSELKQYLPADPQKFLNFLDQVMGYG